MIGSCDNCGKQNVPVKHYSETYCGETTQCFICTGWGEPDPFCELEDVETPVAKVMSTLGMFCLIFVAWFSLVYEGMKDVV